METLHREFNNREELIVIENGDEGFKFAITKSW